MKSLVERNLAILSRFEDVLATKISSEKSRDKVAAFLQKAKILTLQIGKIIPHEEVATDRPERQSKDLVAEFSDNTRFLLKHIPECDQVKNMRQLPDFFPAAMEKIIAYLGDDSWIKKDSDPDNSSAFSEGICLSMERHDNFMKEAEKENPIKEPEEATSVSSETRGLAYPKEYHSLSGETTIGQIIDPLFELLFPKNTYLSSEKHCRKTTGMSLNRILATKLGPGQPGNLLLYKLLTDDVLKKSFNDDRIIMLFDQSINVSLLKVIIATALYRLEKRPQKFPVIGGISFFMDIENEMLQTNRICNFLVRFVATPTGARAMFQSTSSRERKGFMDRLASKPKLAQTIKSKLPANPISVTKYWLPKFSALVASGAGISEEMLENYFDYNQLSDIRQFLQYMPTDPA